jgi:CHASE3 domain sensor protein
MSASADYYRSYRAANRDKLQSQRRTRRAELDPVELEALRVKERQWQATRRAKEKALIELARSVLKRLHTPTTLVEDDQNG